MRIWAVFFNMFTAGINLTSWMDGKNHSGWFVALAFTLMSLLVILFGKDDK